MTFVMFYESDHPKSCQMCVFSHIEMKLSLQVAGISGESSLSKRLTPVYRIF